MSIGLPVYNGERYIAATIDSILGQTFEDIELIISDNASTDATPSICARRAASDARVRCSRNERNLGAIPNYNRAFELARGEFFKWAPCDDLLEPRYVEACVAALDARPDAVLCQTLLSIDDGDGRRKGIYDSALAGSDAPLPATRFAAVTLRPHLATETVGVIRSSALAASIMLRSFHGADRALLADLALQGPFVQVREPLLHLREHDDRYTQGTTRARDRVSWHDTGKRRGFSLPTWRVYGTYIWLVAHRLPDGRARARCYATLFAWWFFNWNWARMGVDVVALLFPKVVGHAERFKQRLFSPRPGSFPRAPDAGTPAEQTTLRSAT